MKKHAVCVMAHKNWAQLDDLIDTLGTKFVDVFLHIDKKSRDDFDLYAKEHHFSRHTNVCLINSRPVDWGGIFNYLQSLTYLRKCLRNVTIMNMFT